MKRKNWKKWKGKARIERAERQRKDWKRKLFRKYLEIYRNLWTVKAKVGLKEGTFQESECTTSAATTATVMWLGLSIWCSTTEAPGFSLFVLFTQLIRPQLEHGDPVCPDAGAREARELVGRSQDLAPLPRPPRRRRHHRRPQPSQPGAGVGGRFCSKLLQCAIYVPSNHWSLLTVLLQQ